MLEEDDSFVLRTLGSFNNTCQFNFNDSLSPCFGGKKEQQRKSPDKGLKVMTGSLLHPPSTTKRIEEQRRRVRELEMSNAMQQEKIRQLEVELDTTTRSLELQIGMYKGMLAEQQQDKLRHIQELQSSFAAEMQKVLVEREDDSRALQLTVKENILHINGLSEKVKGLEHQLETQRSEHRHLRNHLSKNEQEKLELAERLDHLEKLLKEAEITKNYDITSLQRQLEQLQQEVHTDRAKNSEQLNNANDYLKELHQEELENLRAKHLIDLQHKQLETDALSKAFDSECRRLEQTIEKKDKFNASLVADLERQKEKLAATTKHYDTQLQRLNTQREHLLRDMEILENERAMLKVECQQLEAELSSNTATAEPSEQSSVSCFGGRAPKKQVNDSLLLEQFNTMKEILTESSRELENCKLEFIRLSNERQQLLSANQRHSEQAQHWKDLYFQLKHNDQSV